MCFWWANHGHQTRNILRGNFIITVVGSVSVFLPDWVHHRCSPYRAHSCGWRNTVPIFLDHSSQIVDCRNNISCGWLLSRVFSGQDSWSALAQVWYFDKADWEFFSVIAIILLCQYCCNKVSQMGSPIQHKFIVLQFWRLEVQHQCVASSIGF